MPNLSCWSCGRQIYTVAPIEALFSEERRCPRCGAFLHEDRRGVERRLTNRRMNPQNDPGPPGANGKAKSRNGTKPTAPKTAKIARGDETAADDGERRVAARREVQRRGGRPSLPSAAANDSGGWRD